MSNELSFDHCICDTPGFCPLFNKIMTDNPPNWQWCQNCSKEERQQYNTINKTKHSYFESLPNVKEDIDLSRFQIAVLGHSEQQYLNITKKPYLNFVMLQDLDLSPYNYLQDNTFAESRVYFCKSIFDYENLDFVGTITASWNYKYINNINDDFIINKFKKLIKNNIKDSIICANTRTLDVWTKYRLIEYLGFNEEEVFLFFDKYFGGVNWDFDTALPLSNQIICHKNIFLELYDYMQAFVLELYNYNNCHKLDRNTHNITKRPLSYLCEIAFMIWFINSKYNVIPITKMKNSWYEDNRGKKREFEDIFEDA